MKTTAHTMLLAGPMALVLASSAAMATVPPMPVPPQNPITEPKRVLGKILFWDEQMSSSNTMSCGTCHVPARGGVDNRRQATPGLDNLFGTPDDHFGSPGVIRSDANRNFKPDSTFAFAVQATPRNSMPYMTAGFSPSNFWDGRARGPFVDPVTGQQLAPPGGSGLEIQALGPPASDVEMGHEGRTWSEVINKLAGVKPLALARNIPADMQAVIGPQTTYGDLFRAAFGSPQITAGRVAQAIATYERTLIPDQTPWDRFVAGDNTALTPGQQAGLNTFNGGGRCAVCHGGVNPTTALFTNNTFRNIGLRPINEDTGLQAVTGNPGDAGRFKVPSLRNVGLRNQFMHNGQFTNITDVVRFYVRAPGAAPQFPQNQDPVIAAIAFPPQAEPALVDFLTNGLTDPRVAAQTFPFDRPTLFAQRPQDQPAAIPGGVPGTGGITPQVIVGDPPMLGNADFRIGVQNALGGAAAQVIMTDTPPVGGRLIDGNIFPIGALSGAGAAGGFGTLHWPVPLYGQLSGRTFFFQWQITDPSAAGGVALSNIARVTFFCPSQGCPPACIADFNLDADVTPDDLGDFITGFFSPAPPASIDVNGDGMINPDDLGDFITAYFSGCGSV